MFSDFPHSIFLEKLEAWDLDWCTFHWVKDWIKDRVKDWVKDGPRE